jgi:hypothetical protein
VFREAEPDVNVVYAKIVLRLGAKAHGKYITTHNTPNNMIITLIYNAP